MSAEPTVTIPKSEYDRLIKVDEKMAALEAAGIDNWEGYDFAMEMLRDRRPE